LKCLRKFVEIFEETKAPYAVLGGVAIPAYGVPRSTVDIDIGLAASEEEKIQELVRKLKARKVVAFEEVKPEHPMVYMSDRENLVDVELWFKPDGIAWNEEILRRRWGVSFKLAKKAFKAYVLSPEDFIVNKLARRDRSARDEEDVVGVMASSRDKIDWRYLARRAREAGVEELVLEIKEKISLSKR
jgi:hypothetical protein